jgi:hypothetical protein
MKRKDNVFSQVFTPRVESNAFDLSHEKKFTLNMGELVPVTCMEVLPGDSFHISFVNMARMFPLVAPVMHKIRIHTDYFFVPNRILWAGWEDFITGVSPDAPPILRVGIDTLDTMGKGTVADYMGIPPGDYGNSPVDINALPVAAYVKIYDDWYRAQQFITEKFTPLVSGDNTDNYETIFNRDPLHRAWEHDYFTSALPTTQQGTDVEIPLTFQDNIPVHLTPGNSAPGLFAKASDHSGITAIAPALNASGPSPFAASLHVNGDPAVYNPNGSLSVDVQSDAATINDLREAFSLQSFLERSIRGGVRYVEQLFSLFNVRSSDARLQRAEWIGRDIQNMTIGEVLATAQSSNDIATAEVPLGTMAGHGISVGGRDGIHYTAEEHGFIIGIVSIIPDSSYQDGISKQWVRNDRLDYAFPDFAHLGEQPIYLREVQSVLADDIGGDIFGYMPRYSEYRYHPSMVAAEFRDTLAYWSLGRIFNNPSSPPALNSDFTDCNPRLDIFAVTDPDVDHIIMQVINKITVMRKLPRHGVPSIL